jgi:DNA-binding transcriptional MerR regulator
LDTTYTIQMASKISGVGVHTIRAWEKRYKALEPTRDSSGHRVYNKSDIEKLILLSELCFVGYAISKVAKFSIAELKDLLKSLGKVTEDLPADGFNLIKEQTTIQASDSLGILQFALANLKLDIIHVELAKLKVAVSAKDFVIHILYPLYLQAHDLKASGSLTLQQYHILLQIIKCHAGHYIFHHHSNKEHSTYSLLIGGVKLHSDEFFLQMVALISSHYKIHLTFLELSHSVDELIETINFLRPTSLFLSFLDHDASSTSTILERLQQKLQFDLEILTSPNVKGLTDKISLKKVKIFSSIQEIDQYMSNRKTL